MDVLIILAMIGFCLWKIFSSSAPPEEDQNQEEAGEQRQLTSTQLKWRAMKREIELSKMGEQETEITSRWEEAARLQAEMNEYVLTNKRPFHLIVWLFDAIDPRLQGEYIRKMVALGIFYALLMWLFGGISLLTLLIWVVGMDYLMYNKQLVLEVTVWNTEYQEKFAKRSQALGPFE